MTVSHGNEMKSKTRQTRTTNGVVEMVKIHGNDNEVEYKTIKANQNAVKMIGIHGKDNEIKVEITKTYPKDMILMTKILKLRENLECSPND